MFVILSPAVNMELVNPPTPPLTLPVFQLDAYSLVEQLRIYDPWELESLLGVSDRLALRAWEYYQQFGQRSAHPALLSFRGLAYRNLAPETFGAEDLAYAAEHLRMLSALYGLLRPLDGISPYRLDFLCTFSRRVRLYRFWGERVYRELFGARETVINLCSGEYGKLVTPYRKRADHLVECRFLVRKAGKLRCQATASKMARGQMARFIICNRIDSPRDLQAFNWDGYQYEPQLSTSDCMTFVQQ